MSLKKYLKKWKRGMVKCFSPVSHSSSSPKNRPLSHTHTSNHTHHMLEGPLRWTGRMFLHRIGPVWRERRPQALLKWKITICLAQWLADSSVALLYMEIYNLISQHLAVNSCGTFDEIKISCNYRSHLCALHWHLSEAISQGIFIQIWATNSCIFKSICEDPFISIWMFAGSFKWIQKKAVKCFFNFIKIDSSQQLSCTPGSLTDNLF